MIIAIRRVYINGEEVDRDSSFDNNYYYGLTEAGEKRRALEFFNWWKSREVKDRRDGQDSIEKMNWMKSQGKEVREIYNFKVVIEIEGLEGYYYEYEYQG